MILFVDATVRTNSRTRKLAGALLEKIGKPYETVKLSEMDFPPVTEAFLDERDAAVAQLANGNSDGILGNKFFALSAQFAQADEIVIAAPYWDNSFPASLKQYVEQINVLGVTFTYTPEGVPAGLCKAGRIYYVMTAGGPFVDDAFGFGYIKSLANSYWGIKDVVKISAVGLDIVGADPDKIVAEAIEAL